MKSGTKSWGKWWKSGKITTYFTTYFTTFAILQLYNFYNVTTFLPLGFLIPCHFTIFFYHSFLKLFWFFFERFKSIFLVLVCFFFFLLLAFLRTVILEMLIWALGNVTPKCPFEMWKKWWKSIFLFVLGMLQNMFFIHF